MPAPNRRDGPPSRRNRGGAWSGNDFQAFAKKPVSFADQPRLMALKTALIPEDQLLECPICCDPMPYVAFGGCNDYICWLCCAKLRRVQKSKACPFCKLELDFVTVAKAPPVASGNAYSPEDIAAISLSPNDYPPALLDETSGMLFATDDVRKLVTSLFERVCWHPACTAPDWIRGQGSKTSFANDDDWKLHCSSKHKMTPCTVCLAHREVFKSEQLLFIPSDVKRHFSEGECSARAGIRPHVRCSVCRESLFDSEQYLDHVKKEHVSCFLCDASFTGGPNPPPAFRDLGDLAQHYRESHFACTVCDFVAFGNSGELRLHMMQQHAESARASAFIASRAEMARISMQAAMDAVAAPAPVVSNNRNDSNAGPAPYWQYQGCEPVPHFLQLLSSELDGFFAASRNDVEMRQAAAESNELLLTAMTDFLGTPAAVEKLRAISAEWQRHEIGNIQFIARLLLRLLKKSSRGGRQKEPRSWTWRQHFPILPPAYEVLYLLVLASGEPRLLKDTLPTIREQLFEGETLEYLAGEQTSSDGPGDERTNHESGGALENEDDRQMLPLLARAELTLHPDVSFAAALLEALECHVNISDSSEELTRQVDRCEQLPAEVVQSLRNASRANLVVLASLQNDSKDLLPSRQVESVLGLRAHYYLLSKDAHESEEGVLRKRRRDWGSRVHSVLAQLTPQQIAFLLGYLRLSVKCIPEASRREEFPEIAPPTAADSTTSAAAAATSATTTVLPGMFSFQNALRRSRPSSTNVPQRPPPSSRAAFPSTASPQASPPPSAFPALGGGHPPPPSSREWKNQSGAAAAAGRRSNNPWVKVTHGAVAPKAPSQPATSSSAAANRFASLCDDGAPPPQTPSWGKAKAPAAAKAGAAKNSQKAAGRPQTTMLAAGPPPWTAAGGPPLSGPVKCGVCGNGNPVGLTVCHHCGLARLTGGGRATTTTTYSGALSRRPAAAAAAPRRRNLAEFPTL